MSKGLPHNKPCSTGAEFNLTFLQIKPSDIKRLEPANLGILVAAAMAYTIAARVSGRTPLFFTVASVTLLSLLLLHMPNLQDFFAKLNKYTTLPDANVLNQYKPPNTFYWVAQPIATKGKELGLEVTKHYRASCLHRREQRHLSNSFKRQE